MTSLLLDLSAASSYQGDLLVAGQAWVSLDLFPFQKEWGEIRRWDGTQRSTFVDFGTPSFRVLAMIDLRGHRLRHFDVSALAPGDHQLRWDGRDEEGKSVASGVYLFRLSTSMGQDSRRAILLK